VSDVTAPEVPQPAQLMDDFYVIALWVASWFGSSSYQPLNCSCTVAASHNKPWHTLNSCSLPTLYCLPGDIGGSVKYNVRHHYFGFRKLVYMKCGSRLSLVFRVVSVLSVFAAVCVIPLHLPERQAQSEVKVRLRHWGAWSVTLAVGYRPVPCLAGRCPISPAQVTLDCLLLVLQTELCLVDYTEVLFSLCTELVVLVYTYLWVPISLSVHLHVLSWKLLNGFQWNLEYTQVSLIYSVWIESPKPLTFLRNDSLHELHMRAVCK
jgi:hypothetical protein